MTIAGAVETTDYHRADAPRSPIPNARDSRASRISKQSQPTPLSRAKTAIRTPPPPPIAKQTHPKPTPLAQPGRAQMRPNATKRDIHTKRDFSAAQLNTPSSRPLRTTCPQAAVVESVAVATIAPMLRLRSLFIILPALAAGCSHPDGKATVITQPPAPETVTIDLATDLGPLEAHTVSLLRPSSANPPDALLAPLRRLSIDRIPTLVTLGESVKFDGRFPGDKKDWTKWDQGVEKLVRQNKAAAKPVEYEIWNEPDRAANFKGSQADFFSIWVHTARLIRSIDPEAPLVGPSISKHDHPWTQEFLKIGKEFDVPTTIVCWHENSTKPDLPGHINGVGEAFWQDGTDRASIRILPSNAIDRTYNPADPILFLAPLQQAYRETSFRGIDERFGIKLHHLITKDRTPRSLYYAYTAYADLIQRGGHAAKVSSSKTVDGLATWDASKRTARLLIARNFARAATTQPTPGQAPANQLGPLTLLLKNVRGGTAHVTVSTITDSGDQAFTPSAATERVVPIAEGQIRLPLTEMASGQVYVMELKVTGTPATTQASTRPSTQPKL
jgi:hypothetical protein